jgi:hypothetical protein
MMPQLERLQFVALGEAVPMIPHPNNPDQFEAILPAAQRSDDSYVALKPIPITITGNKPYTALPHSMAAQMVIFTVFIGCGYQQSHVYCNCPRFISSKGIDREIAPPYSVCFIVSSAQPRLCRASRAAWPEAEALEIDSARSVLLCNPQIELLCHQTAVNTGILGNQEDLTYS